MRQLLLLLAVCLYSFSLTAQSTARIYGTVKDENGQPMASATVSLLKAKDSSSLVKVAITDKAGIFEFINIKEGNYILSYTSVGFGKTLSKAFEYRAVDIEMASATLKPRSKDMSNVTITATKPFIESKLDKTIVNVDASPTSAGSTALEVLEKSPGVMVNVDGAISLRGKQGVIIMMDGKQTYLSPTDLATLLRNTPASALETIEIMTNPSAKYDASGNAGIINIKTKKGKNDGFNGSFMLGVSTGIYNLDGTIYLTPKSQNSVNFNYKKGKLNYFGNYNPNFFRGRSTMDLNNKQIDPKDGLVKGYTDQQTRFKFGNFNQNLKLGMDWFANKKNVYGVVASGFLFNGHPTPVTEANMYDVNYNLENQMISKADNDIGFRNFTGNLNWKHNFDSTAKELTADFDYVMYRNETDMHLVTDAYDNTQLPTGHTELRGHIPVDVDIVSFKSDYTRPLKNGRFDAGFKASFVKTDNLVNYDTKYGNDDWRHDYVRSNHFIYRENVNAAYINLNKQFKKWTVQGGLRVENTIAEGDQLTSNKSFDKNYTELFPTAFVSYTHNKKHTFNINYGRRIMRPNYQDMNPFMFFLDTLSYRQGNPDLNPQFTNVIELSHAFMGKFITTLSYSNTDDVIAQIIKPVDSAEGKIRYLMPDNVANLKNLSLSITAPLPVQKWWTLNFFGTVYNNHYTGVYDTIPIDLQFTSFTINVTNTFTIKKGLTAELSGFYRHKALDQLTRTEPVYQMSFGLQKIIMEGRGTLRLNVRDPFAWQTFEGLNQYGYIDMHFKNRPDTRQVTLNFTYRFGKQQQLTQRRRAGSSQEEQSRVGGTGGN